MVYEAAVLLRPNLAEEDLGRVKTIFADVLKEAEGEVVFSDDWGKRTLAWPLKKGQKVGHYLYFVYKANGEANKELDRRFRIDDSVVRSLVIKLGDPKKVDVAALEKDYRSPFA